MTAYMLAQVAKEVNFPKGVLNITSTNTEREQAML